MELYDKLTRQAFETALGWLHGHACSRSYGLGTCLPWDEQWLVESLLDSTIYMAYYTVAHLLQGGQLNGQGRSPIGIDAKDMTADVWDYIFLGRPYRAGPVPEEKLQRLRHEFNYFYPLDLRVSGKDLIQNHLTFSIYNHCAIFPEKHWPKSFRANGHLLLNAEKMSKSTGNFLTLEGAVKTYTADGTRLNLADAGDSSENANFESNSANAAVLRLYTLTQWVEETLKDLPKLATGPIESFVDRAFYHEINHAIAVTDTNYANMHYKAAVISGLFELQSARDRYILLANANKLPIHRDLIVHYIKIQAILISPICPHFAEHAWHMLGESGSITATKWPAAPAADQNMIRAGRHLENVARFCRTR
jgi:leucyl-tRNA synthetase